jgi:hypothetical protein
MTRRLAVVAIALACMIATPAFARHQQRQDASRQVTQFCGDRVCGYIDTAADRHVAGAHARATREARRHPSDIGVRRASIAPAEQSIPEFRAGNSAIAAAAERYVGSAPSVAQLRSWAHETGIGSWSWGQHVFCALGVNKVLNDVGIRGSGSFKASSFRHWGQHTYDPQPGDIAVVGSYHVAIVVARTPSSVMVVSFNDSGHAIRRVEYPLRGVQYRTASL